MTSTFNFTREVTDMAPDAFIPLVSKGPFFVLKYKYENDYLYLYDRSTHRIFEVQTTLEISTEEELDQLVQSFHEQYQVAEKH